MLLRAPLDNTNTATRNFYRAVLQSVLFTIAQTGRFERLVVSRIAYDDRTVNLRNSAVGR